MLENKTIRCSIQRDWERRPERQKEERKGRGKDKNEKEVGKRREKKIRKREKEEKGNSRQQRRENHLEEKPCALYGTSRQNWIQLETADKTLFRMFYMSMVYWKEWKSPFWQAEKFSWYWVHDFVCEYKDLIWSYVDDSMCLKSFHILNKCSCLLRIFFTASFTSLFLRL